MTKEEFKKIRLYLNLTQKQFASLLKISQVVHYESGRLPIRPQTARLARIFELLSKLGLLKNICQLLNINLPKNQTRSATCTVCKLVTNQFRDKKFWTCSECGGLNQN